MKSIYLLVTVFVILVILILSIKPETQLPEDIIVELHETKEIPLTHSMFSQCLGRDNSALYLCAAVLSQNISYCDAIISDDRRMHCQAYLKKEPQLCLNNTDPEWCLADLGLNLWDEDICDMIGDKDKRLACLSVARKDIDLCMSLNNSELCLVQLSEILG